MCSLIFCSALARGHMLVYAPLCHHLQRRAVLGEPPRSAKQHRRVPNGRGQREFKCGGYGGEGEGKGRAAGCMNVFR